MILRPARILEGIAELDAARWDALAGDGQPFVKHAFLEALERSGCVGEALGWAPRHLILEDAAGRPAAALPLYRKMHSRGEFVFDFSWANAYAQHGLRYYPKLLTAVPFTPVGGPRLLVRAGPEESVLRRALVQAALDYAKSERVSSWHVLFPGAPVAESLQGFGLTLRRDCQFHWYNQNYESFDAFLATFTAEKRKKAKRERRRVQEAGIEFDTRHGHDMTEELWRCVYGFYADTFHRHGHEPYLNLDFFKRIGAALPDSLMLKIARQGSTPIAAAIFFVGEEALFGRYWGAGGN